jgi:hypothetical protein
VGTPGQASLRHGGGGSGRVCVDLSESERD